MDWQETVIKDIPQGTEPQTTLCRHCAYMASQAEISFKAGQESMGEPWDREQTVFEDGKKAGIREVVEWILAHSELERCDPDVMVYFIDYLAVDYPDWQAKLKEWGIE